MSEITRSYGIAVTGGYVVGGGFEGLTKQLDDTVKAQAEWLMQQFPEHDVQIRFNSDRKSGGAFIESSHTLDGVVFVKLGARLASSEATAISKRFQRGEITLDEYLSKLKHPVYDRIVYDIGINVKCTAHSCSEVPEYGDILWKDMDSNEAAMAYIRDHVQKITPKVY